MKLNEIYDQYLPNSLDDLGVQTIVDAIKADCKEFIEAYKSTNKFIYRGVVDAYSSTPYAFTSSIRQDRKPIDMPAPFHKLINTAMTRAGIKAHRGNSIFCTTEPHTAAEWGKVYIVFVKDGWSGTVFDFDTRGETYVYHRLKELASKAYEKPNAIEKMTDEIKNLNPRVFSNSTGLQNIIEKNYADIIITGSHYYGVRVNDEGKPFDSISRKILKNILS
jgi:hypothetical protein